MNIKDFVSSCEVCGSPDLIPVLQLGNHPMCDDLVPLGSERKCEMFPIEINLCPKCFTAHQKYQIPKTILFPKNYHYRARYTADVLLGMRNLVDSIEEKYGSVRDKIVIDIGCNDGSLLDQFLMRGARTIGVEPTNAYIDAANKNHIIINDFFSIETTQRILEIVPKIDIITFTNVFAHIEDLPSLLDAVSRLMNDKTILVIENHYLGAVLEKKQFDTFYHEHPRTYSLHSFLYIAKTLNAELVKVEFPQRYGGNIRVIISKTKEQESRFSTEVEDVLSMEKKLFINRFADLSRLINIWKEEKTKEIKSVIQKHGKIKAKAFPGRAAILIALLGLTEDDIECVYEKPGSLKIGNYLPGTRIPIKSDEELFLQIKDLKVILNLAWHISSEIERYLREVGFRGEIIQIL